MSFFKYMAAIRNLPEPDKALEKFAGIIDSLPEQKKIETLKNILNEPEVNYLCKIAVGGKFSSTDMARSLVKQSVKFKPVSYALEELGRLMSSGGKKLMKNAPETGTTFKAEFGKYLDEYGSAYSKLGSPEMGMPKALTKHYIEHPVGSLLMASMAPGLVAGITRKT